MTTPTIERSPRYPPSAPLRSPLPSGPPRKPPAELAVPMPVLAGLATLCTTLCLGNLFDGVRWWFLPSAGAIVLAGIVGELGRRIRTPLVVMPLLYAFAGWLYVIPVAAGSEVGAHLSLVPNGTTFAALRALAQSGSNDIRALSVPVPDRPGFLFLTVAGVYLIATLVDAVAIGLARPAAAGLPLLALLAVPAAVVERGVGLGGFLAACVAYVAMLLASGRRGLASWAPLPTGAAPAVRRMSSAAGRRIGAVAIIAALAVPVVIPRYAGIAREHHGSGGGGGSATVIEPVVTLAQQLHSLVTQPLLTVHTNIPEYLRLTALEHFDGESFTLGSLSAGRQARVSRGLPAAAAGAAERVQATIDVKPLLHQRYLPVPYQATKVTIGGDWRLASRNFTIFSAQTDTSGAHYTVTSEVANPTAEVLRSQSAGASVPTDVAPSTVLPGDLSPQVSQLSSQLTDASNTEYDKAAAIQAYLRGPLFTYDLTGAPTGRNALVDFLLHDRRGYCEQFAGAMVVLARAAGIPARVAIGFTPGQLQPDGSYLITNHDAHSWPEIWFPQAGWVRFEPTKRDGSTTPPSYTFPPSAGQPSPTPSATAAAGPRAVPNAGPKRAKEDQRTSAAAGTNLSRGGRSGGAALGWSVGVVALAGLVLTPAALRRRRRRRRLGGSTGLPPGGAWREIVDTAFDLGLALTPTLTPRRAVQHWSGHGAAGERRMPQVTCAVLMEVALAEERARYAAASDPNHSNGPTDRRSHVANPLRSALGDWERSYGRRVRLRARLAPRSMIMGATGWGLRTLTRLPARSNRTPSNPVDQT